MFGIFFASGSRSCRKEPGASGKYTFEAMKAVGDWAAERDSILRRLRENDPGLARLDDIVYGNSIGAEGAKALADALRENWVLT